MIKTLEDFIKIYKESQRVLTEEERLVRREQATADWIERARKDEEEQAQYERTQKMVREYYDAVVQLEAAKLTLEKTRLELPAGKIDTITFLEYKVEQYKKMLNIVDEKDLTEEERLLKKEKEIEAYIERARKDDEEREQEHKLRQEIMAWVEQEGIVDTTDAVYIPWEVEDNVVTELTGLETKEIAEDALSDFKLSYAGMWLEVAINAIDAGKSTKHLEFDNKERFACLREEKMFYEEEGGKRKYHPFISGFLCNKQTKTGVWEKRNYVLNSDGVLCIFTENMQNLITAYCPSADSYMQYHIDANKGRVKKVNPTSKEEVALRSAARWRASHPEFNQSSE
jgi:hypothetical protein